jgi:hypothetical protein
MERYTSEARQMRINSKTICLTFLAVIAGGLAFCIGTELLGLHIAEFGARTYVLGSIVAVPVSIILTILELRRPEGAVRWPLILLVVAALPPLLLMAIFWGDPD